jgi:two-component system, NarL family, response regulator LiaR
MPIRVLIVDDHRVVRRGLSLVLDQDPELEAVGEAGDGAEALRLAEALRPDVVLMDVVMPVLDGISATMAIRRAFPATQVLALTSTLGDQTAVDAVRAGAVGYLLKDATPEEVCRAVKAAATGTPHFAPEAATQLIRALAVPDQATAPGHSGDSSSPQRLTDREATVLSLLGQGKSNREIAGALAIGESTVKTHIHHVLTKLGLHSRTQAALYAAEHRPIDQHRATDLR